MFNRLSKIIKLATALTAVSASTILSYSNYYMIDGITNQYKDSFSIQSLSRSKYDRIRYYKNLDQYIDKLQGRGKSIIIYELSGDKFIDEQVKNIAQYFIQNYSKDISVDYQFVFLQQNNIGRQEDNLQHFFILFTRNGQKMINLDPYLNKNHQKSYIKINNKNLMKRLIEGMNIYREISLQNISLQLRTIDNDNDYIALFTGKNRDESVQQSIDRLNRFEKRYLIRNKNINKYIIKDEQSNRILGNKQYQNNRICLLVYDNKNIKQFYRQKLQFFTINGKRYTLIDPQIINLEDIFIFPPLSKKIESTQLILNISINKNNNNNQKIQSQIYRQLSKQKYNNIHKNIYYNNIQQPTIYLQPYDYSNMSVLAYQKNTILDPQLIKNILTKTYQYKYIISNQGQNLHHLYQWIQDCKNQKIQQHYQSQKITQVWAQQLTGQQYKKVRDQPGNKVIYHYSNHCHGCKKFGGNYENFAKNRKLNNPNISFYRINNDYNKAQGVRNYNSTPVFVFYKDKSTNPFLYKLPLFTDKLFSSFLSITSQINLSSQQQLNRHINERNNSNMIIKQLLDEMNI